MAIKKSTGDTVAAGPSIPSTSVEQTGPQTGASPVAKASRGSNSSDTLIIRQAMFKSALESPVIAQTIMGLNSDEALAVVTKYAAAGEQWVLRPTDA